MPAKRPKKPIDATVKRCKSCGTPDNFGKRVVWTEGGTIRAEKVPTLRLFFMEIDELLNLLSFLSELLGVPIDNILIEAERPIGRELVESIFSPAMVKFTSSVPNALHFRSLRQRGLQAYRRV